MRYVFLFENSYHFTNAKLRNNNYSGHSKRKKLNIKDKILYSGVRKNEKIRIQTE